MKTSVSNLLSEIRDATGWSDAVIAGHIDVSQPTIHRLRTDKGDCKGKTFIAILDLHKKVFSEHEAA